MRKFAERLKELRTEKNLSILVLSQKTGLSVGSISRWENGLNDIKADQLIIIAKFFEVSPNFLLGFED